MFFTPKVPSITPEELRTKMDDGRAPMLVDVREPHEIAAFQIDPAAVRIRMSELDRGLSELPKDGREVVVYCSGGVRSAKAIKFWSDAGLTNLWNLSGGSDAWNRLPRK